MFKNYFKLAYRNLLKNKAASTINIAGLAIAVACGIVAYMYVYGELFSDAFHENADDIYLVEMVAQLDNETARWASTPNALGPRIAADFPQVRHAVRIQDAMVTVIDDENEFGEVVRFADSGFMDMFTYPLKYGAIARLEDRDAAILGYRTAMRLFGDKDPTGELVTIRLENGDVHAFTVRGVAEQTSFDSIANFSILLTYGNYEALRPDGNESAALEEWQRLARATFVQIQNSEDVETVESQIETYVSIANSDPNHNLLVQSFQFNNLKRIKATSSGLKNGFGFGIPWAPMIILSTISLFLFLLACFNYINITLGATQFRIKEIGIRKVIGSNKSQLVLQFLSENILLCLASLVLGIIVAITIFLPGFNSISGAQFTFDILERPDLWVFLIGLLLITGFASGAYPAFYISSLKPTTIFTGRFKMGAPNKFMQSLLTFQFVLAMITMMLSVGFSQNSQFLKEKDWGYDNSNTLVVRLHPDAYPIMLNEANQLPNVLSASGAETHVGSWPHHNVDVSVSGQKENVVQFNVGEGYLDIIQPRLKEGAHPTLPAHVLINEQLAERFDDVDPVGQSVTIDSTAYIVSGIVENFHYSDFSNSIQPALFSLSTDQNYGFLVMKLKPGTEQETISTLASIWNSHYPEAGFNNYFQEDSFGGHLNEAQGIRSMFFFFAALALVLSCAGLFGLASQNIASRMKEMSIRKILGASVSNVIKLSNRSFAIQLIIAAILATPVSYVLITAMLDSYSAYSMSLGPATFAIAFSLILLTALITLSIPIYRLIVINPAELLRDE